MHHTRRDVDTLIDLEATMRDGTVLSRPTANRTQESAPGWPLSQRPSAATWFSSRTAVVVPLRRTPAVRYLSQYLVLEPGDVVNTGTPAAVALSLPGQPYLRPGPSFEMKIDRPGTQSQTFTHA